MNKASKLWVSVADQLHPVWGFVVLSGATLLADPLSAHAQSRNLASFDFEFFAARTALLDIAIDSARTARIAHAARTRYELSDGTPVDASDWYQARRRDFSVNFLTAFSDNFGLIWGVAAGDTGPKYTISPSFKIGFIAQHQLAPLTWLTLRATIDLGGMTEEFPCTANYGEIGGIQPVNCRLAATPLPPEETLNHLFRDTLGGAPQVSLTFTHRF
jgi:hypothetical protein